MAKFMKCGCSITRDESETVFGNKAVRPGDWCYCRKHGDCRYPTEEEEAIIQEKKKGKRNSRSA